MTDSLKPSVRFGVDWKTITPEAAAKVPLVVADSVGGLHLVKDREENTPLHLAAEYSKTPGVIAALAEANYESRKLLHINALKKENAEYTSVYIENAKGETPLMVAVRCDNAAVAEPMIDTSNRSYNGYHDVDGNVDIFWVVDNVLSSDMAYEIGAAIGGMAWDVGGYEERDNYTPLQYAVLVAQKIDAVKGFLGICPVAVGAYSDEIGSAKTEHGTILHLAVMEGSSGEMIKAIIDAGVDVNYLDKNGMTALDYVPDDDWRVTEVLRKAGGYVCDEKNGVCFGVDWKTATPADVAKVNNDYRGRFGSPIGWAVRFCPDPEVTDALVVKGADVGGLLCMAVRENPHLEVIKALINAGGNVNERDEEGRASLHYAAGSGNMLVATCLIEAGADVNIVARDHDDDTFGETPLDWVDGEADSDIGKMLIAAGAVCAVDLLTIRTAKRNDDEISRLLDMPDEMRVFTEMAEAEGWNPGLHDGAYYHIVDESGFLIGANGGEDIATVSAVRYGGGFGFLGFYIVRGDMRGRGFGLRMWRAAMDRLQGCDVVGLDGVADQTDNYAKSGFKFAFLNIRRELTGDGEMPTGFIGGKAITLAALVNSDITKTFATMPAKIVKDGDKDGIVNLSALDFDDVAAYLLPFFPAPRRAFYRAWIRQPEVVALGYLRGGKLVGVGVMRKCRNGRKVAPLFADDDGIADMLLRALKAQAAADEPLFMDMPDINPAAEPMARWHKMKECFTIARMYKGKMPTLPMRKIYAITSPEIG